MATESIQINVVISDNSAASKLACALEHAIDAAECVSQPDVLYTSASGDDLKRILNNVTK